MAVQWNRRPTFRIVQNRSRQRVLQYPDEPGRYYDEAGEPCSEELARQAGYDVEADKIEEETLRAEEEARERIRREADLRIAQIRAGGKPKVETSDDAGAPEPRDVAARVEKHGEKYAVTDPSGNVLADGLDLFEAVQQAALANELPQAPALDPKVRSNGRPTGTFDVIGVDGKVAAKDLNREKAEARLLAIVNGKG